MIYRELTRLRKEITRLSQENKALKTALPESDSQQLSQSLGELAKLQEKEEAKRNAPGNLSQPN